MHIFIGLLIGIFIGIIQFRLLIAYNRGVTRRAGDEGAGSLFTVAGIVQLILPFAVLVLIAFIYTEALLGCGIGLATTLIVMAVVTALLERRRK